jgi:hypothetical protein
LATRISKVFFDKSVARYKIRWTDDDGKSRSFSRADKRPVEAKRWELMGGSEVSELEPIPAAETFDGSPESYRRLSVETMKAAYASLKKRDFAALDGYYKATRVYANLSGASLPHSAYEELENEHEELIRYHEDVDKVATAEDVQELSAADQGIDSTLQGGEKSQNPLYRSGDRIRAPGRPKCEPKN